MGEKNNYKRYEDNREALSIGLNIKLCKVLSVLKYINFYCCYIGGISSFLGDMLNFLHVSLLSYSILKWFSQRSLITNFQIFIGNVYN